MEEVDKVTINFRNLILTTIFDFKGLAAKCHSFWFISICCWFKRHTVYHTEKAREQKRLTTFVFKESLTQDFGIQVFFMKQFPPGRPPSILLRPFLIFTKIRGDCRKFLFIARF